MYAAYISLYGKRTCLGRFRTQAEAHAVYMEKKREIKALVDRAWGRA
ncbi:hypothetical protein [Paraburkholderia youngii]|nr:hypothetical protein [Paraburkholderia youngii]